MHTRLLFAALCVLVASSVPAQVKGLSQGGACLTEIRNAYRDEFLTYAGAMRLWWTKLKDRFGSELAEKEQSLIHGRVMFDSALRCYESSSGSKALSADLSPSAFKGVFNGIVKDRSLSVPPL